MKGLAAMLRKEWMGQVRSYRLHTAAAMFLVVAIASPLLAALMPEILANIPAERMGSIELLLLKEPGVTDALSQYQRNHALLPILIILANMDAIGVEVQRGTAQSLLSMPLSRSAFVLAKFLVPAALYTLLSLVSGVACFAYTSLFFGEVHCSGFALLSAMFLLGNLGYLGLTLAVSATGVGSGLAAGIGLGTYVVLSTAAGWSAWLQWTPGGLFDAAGRIVLGQEVAYAGLTLVAGAAFVLGTLLFSLLSFRWLEL